MPPPAAILFATIPFAGLAIIGRGEAWRDRFLVGYVAVLGILLSAIAIVDDHYGLTSIIGVFSGPTD
jgi:hypothetical protein